MKRAHVFAVVALAASAVLAADVNKRRAAAGLEPLPAWTCAACAAAGVGCASCKAVVIFRAH